MQLPSEKFRFRDLTLSAVSLLVIFTISSPAWAEFDQNEMINIVTESGSCLPLAISIPDELSAVADDTTDNQMISIGSDRLDTLGPDTIRLTGSVVMQQGRRGIYADSMVYHRNTHRVQAEGSVVLYTLNGDELWADSMDLDFERMSGVADTVFMRITDPDTFSAVGSSDSERGVIHPRLRVEADSLRLEGRNHMTLENAVMTTCPENAQDITLTAGHLELDHGEGVATARNMTVRIRDVPVFYFPWVTFPIDDQRKTGFLAPSFGDEGISGTMLELPYYINIAPRMDATVTPRVLSNRGVHLLGEFRYLGVESRGNVAVGYLPDDDLLDGENRYSIGLEHTDNQKSGWYSRVSLQEVSDSGYLRDLSGDSNSIALSFVENRVHMGHSGKNFRFHVRVLDHELVNDRIPQEQTPFRLIPEIGVRLKPRQLGRFEVGLDSRISRFRHEDGDRPGGTRTLIRPYVSIPVRRPFGSLEPKLSFYNLGYSLDDERVQSQSDTIPVFSLDGRLILERVVGSGGKSFYHTLEPRLFYVNIPYRENQNSFPVFDARERTPRNFHHMFRENRYFGGDRVGDTEQVAVGLTSRLLENDAGIQRLNLNIGQIHYLNGRKVRQESSEEPLSDNRSELVTELTATINRKWSVTGFSLWDRKSSDLELFSLSAEYYRDRFRSTSITYTEFDQLKQINMELSAPLHPRWQAHVDAAYSLEDNHFRTSTIGLTYGSCCWNSMIQYRYRLEDSGEGSNQIRLTLELDGLGRARPAMGS